jgi:hypothetical protein
MDSVEQWSADGTRVLYAREVMSPEAAARGRPVRPWSSTRMTNLERLTPKGMMPTPPAGHRRTSLVFVNDQTIMNTADRTDRREVRRLHGSSRRNRLFA